MSLLLMSVTREIGVPLIQRLVAQDDEVRVIENDPDLGAIWRELGAFVAAGDPTDVDLIERAAQNVRTMVVFDPAEGRLAAALDGANLAGVARMVVCAASIDDATKTALRGSDTEYVALATGAPRRLLRRSPALPAAVVAEVIDAADDLAGRQRLELNLADSSAWRVLGVAVPREGR